MDGSPPRVPCGVAFDVRALAVDLVLSWILSGNSNAGGAIGRGPSPLPGLRICDGGFLKRLRASLSTLTKLCRPIMEQLNHWGVRGL